MKILNCGFSDASNSPLTMHSFSIIARRALWALVFLLFPLRLYLTLSRKTIILSWEITAIQSCPISLILIADPTGTLFARAVLCISANVIQFANTYIHGDPFTQRFIHLVLLFVLSINLLIFIPHLIALLLGWDGLGLVSFLLVIYYQNPKRLGAGIITALTNRIGDVCLLLRIGWSLNQGHWSVLNIWPSRFRGLLTLSIMLAAITKRAQIPFSRWLPAAIAAPTPVSALVHSSTLVTAGVFLIIRFFPFLNQAAWFKPTLLFIATLTIVIAGLRAITECDLKKIIALSTLSQLGVIIGRLGLGLPHLAFFHLITHALFKALLFVCGGTLIHYHLHGQDLRRIGGLTNRLPITIRSLTLANLALCGAPFIAGFYSKDAILESSLSVNVNLLIVFLFFFATALTAAYSVRITVRALWRPVAAAPCNNVADEDIDLTTPITCLTIGAIVGGSALNWLFITPINEVPLPLPIKTAALSATVLGVALAYSANAKTTPLEARLPLLPTVHTRFCFIWFLTPISSQGTIKIPISLAHQFSKSLDQGWSETLGARGLQVSLSHNSGTNQLWQRRAASTHLGLSLLLVVPLIVMILCLDSLNLKHSTEDASMVIQPPSASWVF